MTLYSGLGENDSSSSGSVQSSEFQFVDRTPTGPRPPTPRTIRLVPIKVTVTSRTIAKRHNGRRRERPHEG